MMKCIIGTVLVSSVTGILVYYMKINNILKSKNIKCDVETQTHTHIQIPTQTQTQTYKETVTPPNETNLPEYISVEHSEIGDTTNHPRRTTSLSSFFNYIRQGY